MVVVKVPTLRLCANAITTCYTYVPETPTRTSPSRSKKSSSNTSNRLIDFTRFDTVSERTINNLRNRDLWIKWSLEDRSSFYNMGHVKEELLINRVFEIRRIMEQSRGKTLHRFSSECTVAQWWVARLFLSTTMIANPMESLLCFTFDARNWFIVPL